eukprot:g10613.t1
MSSLEESTAEITQTLLEEPEKPQPITLEVAPQVSSEVSPSLSSPPAQAVETPAGAAKAFDPWPSTPVSASWPSQEIQDWRPVVTASLVL